MCSTKLIERSCDSLNRVTIIIFLKIQIYYFRLLGYILAEVCHRGMLRHAVVRKRVAVVFVRCAGDGV